MKKKKSNKKLWKGVPDELRFMCLADIHSVGQHYCTESILKYVIDHMHDCDSTISGTTPFDVIRWVDIVFESCMFPLEFHEASWRSFISELSQILNRSEELLRRVGPSDYNTGFRTRAKTGRLLLRSVYVYRGLEQSSKAARNASCGYAEKCSAFIVFYRRHAFCHAR